jgi:hypothetical protein
MNDTTRTANHLLEDLDNLRHMLGAKGRVRDYGYRNYYNTSDAGPDVESMKRLQELGFVEPGRPNYWHATKAGCKAIGFNAKQIRNALHDE